jgi:hypothetical protein
MPAEDKRSSLLKTVVNYDCKRCYNIGVWCQCQKILFLSSLMKISNKLDRLSLTTLSMLV